MAWKQNEGHTSAGCFGRSRHHRIRPFSSGTCQNEQVEIRPKRILRIQHINPRPRDAAFEKEMHMQLVYKSQGLQAGLVSAGPLTMPKNKQDRGATIKMKAQASTALPNSVDPSGGGSNAMREISASGSKTEFTSPSNVLVGLQNAVYTESGKVVNSESVHGSMDLVTGTENHTDETAGMSLNQRTSHSPNQVTENKGGESDKATSDLDEPSTVATAGDLTSPPLQTKTVSSRLEEHTPASTPQHNGIVSPEISSPLLFFIHGVGGSSDVWQAQMRFFAREGYEIIAPDLIGHGLSCTPKDKKSYHFLEIAADMEEIFDKYCKKRNIVIGHSYGCSFAVMLARRRSRRIQKLVLISGGAPTPLAPQPGIFTMPVCMLGCVRPCLDQGFRKSAFHTSRSPVIDKGEAFSIPTYVLQHTMNGQDWPDGDELYHQWLLCPTLLIYGAQDKLVTLTEEQHMEEVIFRSRLEVIPDASHMVMIEAPDEVNRLLLNFMLEDSTLYTKSDIPQPPVPLQNEGRSVSRVSIRSTKSYKAMPSHLV